MSGCWTSHCFLAVVIFFVTSTSLADQLIVIDQAGQQQVIYEDSHALLIGASQYEHASWNDLNKIPQELEAVATALERRGFTVHMVRDPTEQAFRDAVEEFIDDFGYEPNNRLLVFYSGHGETLDENGYVVPVDAPDPVLDRSGFLRKAVPMSDIMAWARKIRAKHALFLFDSCFSGALFTARSKPTSEYIVNSTNRPVRQFITAGSEDDEVPSVSVFTPLFVAALEGQADFTRDGYVTGSELGVFLLNEVPEVEVGQTQPQYGKIRDFALSKGDFVFQIAPSAASGDRYGGRDVAIFNMIKDSAIAIDFETFLQDYPESPLASDVRNRLALLTERGIEAPDPAAAQAAGAIEPSKVTLLTINDVHRIGGVERGQRGGLARVRSLRRELEAQDPLLLLAGNVIYPSLLSRTYDGAQMIDVLNRLDGDPDGFDSRMFAVLGNHEFDKSKRADAHILAGRIGESQFTWLRSNVAFALNAEGVPEVPGEKNLREWQIIETNGVKVGLFGLTTNVSRPAYVVEIRDPLETARRLSRELRKKGADLVVALTHLSVQQDMAILKALRAEGPDLIIGGHEHTKQQEEVDGRWVLKADAEAVGAWVVRVTPRSGRPPLVEAEYRRLAGDLPLPDEAVQQAVAEWHARHAEEFCRTQKKPFDCNDVVVGEAATELVAEEEQIRSCETNFGNWIADQVRAAFPGAQAAFINAGSLRLNQNIPEGPILRRDLAELFQYDNQLVQVEITGATLREAVENAVQGWPGNGRWLQISGFAFHHDQSDRSSPKVAELVLIEPDGTRRRLEDDKPVKVVTTDYLLGSRGDQGDRDYYDMLPKWDEDLAQERKSLHEVIKESLKPGGKSEPIDPMIEQRIVQVADGQVVEEAPCVPAP